jgi:hypothetical protein
LVKWSLPVNHARVEIACVAGGIQFLEYICGKLNGFKPYKDISWKVINLIIINAFI